MEGWMPLFISKWIGGVKSSGILDWWNTMISGHNEQKA